MTEYVTISEDYRRLDVPSDELILGCVGDVNVRTINFQAPRYCNETDLSTYDFTVQFINAAGSSDAYTVDDLTVGTDTLTFSWLVGAVACAVVGETAVSVVASNVDSGTGDVLNRFLSTTYNWRVLESTTADGGEAIEATSYVETMIAAWQAEIDEAIAASDRSYQTVAAMQDDTDLTAGKIVHTLGFYSAGDGGAAWYLVSSSGTANGMDVLALDNGLFATLQITGESATPEMLGKNSSSDDSTILNRLFALEFNEYRLSGDYTINSSVVVSHQCRILLDGTIQDNVTTSGAYMLDIQADNVSIVGGKITGTGATSSSVSKATINVSEHDRISISNVQFEEIHDTWVVRFDKATNSEIINCTVTRYSYIGFGCTFECYNIRINGNTLTELINTTSSDSYPITVSAYETTLTSLTTTGSGFEVIGNEIDNTGYVHWEGIDAHGGDNITIADNKITGCYTGIAVLTTSYFECSNAKIYGNTIIGADGTSAQKNNFGILCNASNSVVFGNYVENMGNLGGTLTSCGGIAVSEAVENVSIFDNRIIDIDGIGIGICGTGSVSNNYVSFVSDTRFATNFGVNIFSGTTKYDISSNVFRGNDRYTNGIASALGNYQTRVVFKNNETDSYDFSYRVWMVMDKLPNYSPSAVGFKAGIQGDIVWNASPASGRPLGWVCTASATSSSDATWTALANI